MTPPSCGRWSTAANDQRASTTTRAARGCATAGRDAAELADPARDAGDGDGRRRAGVRDLRDPARALARPAPVVPIPRADAARATRSGQRAPGGVRDRS